MEKDTAGKIHKCMPPTLLEIIFKKYFLEKTIILGKLYSVIRIIMLYMAIQTGVMKYIDIV
jgi:hypothetical protein